MAKSFRVCPLTLRKMSRRPVEYYVGRCRKGDRWSLATSQATAETALGLQGYPLAL